MDKRENSYGRKSSLLCLTMFTEHSSNRKIDPNNVCYIQIISAVKTLGQPDDRKGTLETMESHKVYKKVHYCKTR